MWKYLIVPLFEYEWFVHEQSDIYAEEFSQRWNTHMCNCHTSQLDLSVEKKQAPTVYRNTICELYQKA